MITSIQVHILCNASVASGIAALLASFFPCFSFSSLSYGGRVCECVYIYTYIHAYTHTYTSTYIFSAIPAVCLVSLQYSNLCPPPAAAVCKGAKHLYRLVAPSV